MRIDMTIACQPTEHTPRYDGGGVYRCLECGAACVFVDELGPQRPVIPIKDSDENTTTD